MNQSQFRLKGNVPFSWENKPGVSKVTSQEYYPTNIEGNLVMIKLPPPPCPNHKSPRVSSHDIQIPLPPCPFQTPSRSSSRKGGLNNKKRDDPFLAAYKECTKSTRKDSKNHAARSGLLTKGMFQFNLSCKRSCSVRDDNLIRVSQVPYESVRERGEKY